MKWPFEKPFSLQALWGEEKKRERERLLSAAARIRITEKSTKTDRRSQKVDRQSVSERWSRNLFRRRNKESKKKEQP